MPRTEAPAMSPAATTEIERLRALRALGLDETSSEPEFDAVCSLAQATFKVPTVLVSLVDESHQWFKARRGFDAERTSRDVSFCARTILSDAVLVVEDASQDARFHDNPLVIDEPRIRFYAGAPLVLRSGIRVGTICLIDTTPRAFRLEERRRLEEFATIVVALLHLHEANERQRREIADRAAREDLVARQTQDLADREAALRETNELLLMAEEMAGAGHWRLELPSRRRIWSPETARIFGFDPTALPPALGETSDGYHPDDRARVQAAVEAAIQSGRPFALEARVKRPDSSIRTVSVRGICDSGTSGLVRSLSGIIVDVTDSRRTEERLRIRERELTAVLDNMPARIGYVDRDLRVRLANKAYADWFGQGADTVLGTHVRDAIGSDHFAANLPYMEAALRGERQHFERNIINAVGEPHDVQASYVPDVQGGVVLGFFILVVDVTRRKQAEDRLRTSQTFLDRAGRIARVGAWDFDVSSGSFTFSEEALRIHAESRGSFDRSDVLQLYAPEVRATIEDAIRTCVASGQSWDLEVPLVGENATTWVRVTGEVEHAHGKALRVFGILQDVSRRRHAEDDRREKEEQFSLLAENASDMIVRLDATGRRLFVSPAAEDLLGFKPEELIGTQARDTIHPDDVPRFQAMVAGLLGGDKPQDTITKRLKHKDGRWIWVEAKWRILPTTADRPVEFVASVRDVGARLQADERLRASNALYRTLADSLPHMIWIVRAVDRAATYTNEQFHHYYGEFLDDFDERADGTHPDDVVDIEQAWAAATAQGEAFDIEARLRRRDGQYRWHKILATPIYRDGAAAEWLCTALDIDEIVTAQQKLLETSDLLILSQEAAGAGSFSIDLRSGMTTLSRESVAMHGIGGDTAMTMTLALWNARVDPEDGSRSLLLMRKACAERRTYSSEFRVRLPDGRLRWIHGLGRAQYDAAGRAVRMVGLNFDVTDRKASEAKLIEASAAAEAARREAEQASAAKSEFLANMSHEIRTPLNSIIGYTELLLDDGSHKAADRRKLEMIQESGLALLTVVNDILDFSKIEAGEVLLHPVVFALRPMIDNALSMVSDIADKAQLVMTSEVGDDLPAFVLGDANRLRQILLNLLNNAVKFTPRGRITLRVAVESRDAGKCRLRFSVQDTGIGISRLRQRRLFKRFSQVDSSIARRFGGTGLGLAISKSLIDLMDGEIGAESAEGEGSTFWFVIALPVATGAPAAAPSISADAAANGSARILLVEDVLVNQDLARLILEARGHSVTVASDGAEAVRKVQAGDFDIVLMDIQMPGMDGVTATCRIRTLDRPCRTVPIIAMTANVLPKQIAEFKAAGMDDHIGKPFQRDALYDAVARWSRRGSKGQATPRASDFDKDTLQDLRRVLGQTSFESLMGKFVDELKRCFLVIAPDLDRAQLARNAHAMISAAGSLGFTALSRRCREVEEACKQNDDASDAIKHLQDATRHVLHEVASWSGGMVPQSCAPDHKSSRF